jgi:hypothetical protein
MVNIGRKIYYEILTGNVIQDTGERSGTLVVETTLEQDFDFYQSLSERVLETVGCLQLDYGEYAEDFVECNGYRVDVSAETPSLLFSYPDPNEPEAPSVYRKPLSEEIEEVKNQQVLMQSALDDLILNGGAL